MSFPSLPFHPSTPLFPKAILVEEYLKFYAKEFDLLPHISLNVSVLSTKWTGSVWRVALSTGEELDFDRLIVANGHYRIPYYAPIPGLESWIIEKRVTHSAWYRSPQYVGDTILVVGGGPSGNDLASELSTTCQTLIHASPGFPPSNEGNIRKMGRAIRFSDFLADNSRTVFFEDGSSLSGIDHVFLATGYELSFPFFKDLRNSMPEPVPPLPAHLYNSLHHLFPLALDLFPLQADFPPGSAAFIGLPVKVAPFPLFEAQLRAVVQVFANPKTLDGQSEAVALVARYEALREEACRNGGNGEAEDALALVIAHAWHRYKGNEQFEYRDALHAFAGLTGESWRVPQWVYAFYDAKDVLRKEWRAIEDAGESEKWLDGVGKGGMDEWVDLMQKLYDRASKRDNFAPSLSSGDAKL